MKEHKHAEVLRAIADGVPLEEFEIRRNDLRCNDLKTDWDELQDGYSAWFYYPAQWEVRRKPQYITVNGFKVPKPLDVIGHGCDYFLATVFDGLPNGVERFNNNQDVGKQHCERGIAHATKEAAIAHAKAMLGIDPEAQ